ncbi:HEAT repeat-containing protein 1-like [Tachypleus tridentatus]|uniref:HEAT repeat-containing protein 1-like n=1 Tax=Tachypleus tridentatus TaxID=6853 RepID=UPI003FCFA563
MSIFGEHLSVMNKEDLNAHLLDIQNIFVESLNYRSQHYKDPLADVSQVEGHVIACFLKFVLKLSETTFRPVFFKLFMWATQDSESRDKILTFYILSDSLASKLKSLFVLFAGHIVKNTASLLDQNNLVKTESLYFGEKDTDVQKSCMLLQYILSTLEKCFLYDNEGFVTRECFETLMQPLLDQVENLLGTDTDYEDRTTKYLVPCVAQFAVAAKDNSLWKSLNYQLLLKTRHSSARVRFAALQVIREVVIKLAEDYMVLLPEAIPFLAELMEDDSTEVEQQCQSVIAEMEQVLGEPLAKYF